MAITDLTKLPALADFPWEATHVGMARAVKAVTTFNVGAIYKHGLQSVPSSIVRPSEQRWYLALKYGYAVEGFNVNLRDPIKGDMKRAIFNCCDPYFWTDNSNAAYFGDLYEWIDRSELFQAVGRITFFVTLPGQLSPKHTDYTYDGIDARTYVKCTDFLWLTPPDNPKVLLSEGQPVPWACHFDPLAEHETLASPNTQWSLRIDGKFKHGLPLLHP